ncbi:hypothetical protein C4J81_00375 [Deltaproteobacteria bacterium Smac51]|nr:hypothetical protein C4J81_00295 [Deltaproteobacteria bacterium Smac51]UQZ87753.1 hypothetical protein C4J81_00375 [Deltaproteobacteria bacterium Smac51]
MESLLIVFSGVILSFGCLILFHWWEKYSCENSFKKYCAARAKSRQMFIEKIGRCTIEIFHLNEELENEACPMRKETIKSQIARTQKSIVAFINTIRMLS